MEWTWRAHGVKLVRKIVTRQRSCAESTDRINYDSYTSYSIIIEIDTYIDP